MRFKIQTLNNISIKGLERLPRDRFEVASDINNPDAVLVRSADMHKLAVPESLRAVGRAGAGTNNIPVEALSKKGIPVFNAPGANANAVKELVLAGMFLAARNITQAWTFAKAQAGDDHAIDVAVEKGKKNFVGFELPGRTLGVVGLGAIGVEVANSALGLGMKVLGYDPQITVQRAWQLSSNVEQALSLDDLFVRSDIISVHVPLTPDTRGLVNEARLKLMRKNGVILNFARAPIVDEKAIIACARRRPPAGLCLRLPDQCHQGPSEDRDAAASRRLDQRSRGQLRRHGGGHRQGLPRERQHQEQRELPRSGAAARAQDRAHLHRQQQRA